jgi:hypothetical protein
VSERCESGHDVYLTGSLYRCAACEQLVSMPAGACGAIVMGRVCTKPRGHWRVGFIDPNAALRAERDAARSDAAWLRSCVEEIMARLVDATADVRRVNPEHARELDQFIQGPEWDGLTVESLDVPPKCEVCGRERNHD